MNDNYEMFEKNAHNNAVAVVQDSAMMQIEKAQIDSQVATAKQYPRNPPTIIKREMMQYVSDQETAEECFFSIPRGGKAIKGPSVRLAEIAVSCYGNIAVATNVLDTVTSGDNPHVVVESVCIDAEKNVRVRMQKRRRITGKAIYENGQKVGNKPPDEDAINLAVNACSAIAYRDCVFKVIPQALIKPVYKKAMEVATGGALPLEARVGKALERFAGMGVFEDRILLALSREGTACITGDDLETLIGYYNGIRDGDTSIEACFPVSEEKPKSQSVISDLAPKEDSDIDVDSMPLSALNAAIKLHNSSAYFGVALTELKVEKPQDLDESSRRLLLRKLIEEQNKA